MIWLARTRNDMRNEFLLPSAQKAQQLSSKGCVLAAVRKRPPGHHDKKRGRLSLDCGRGGGSLHSEVKLLSRSCLRVARAGARALGGGVPAFPVSSRFRSLRFGSWIQRSHRTRKASPRPLCSGPSPSRSPRLLRRLLGGRETGPENDGLRETARRKARARRESSGRWRLPEGLHSRRREGSGQLRPPWPHRRAPKSATLLFFFVLLFRILLQVRAACS